jgi:hypothetical protein
MQLLERRGLILLTMLSLLVSFVSLGFGSEQILHLSYHCQPILGDIEGKNEIKQPFRLHKISNKCGKGSVIPTENPSNTIWTKTFGGSEGDIAMDVLQLTQGGYLLVGETISYGEGGDAWLIKTNDLGEEEWNTTFGGPYEDWGNDIHETNDGGYIIIGTTLLPGATNYDAWLIKTDALGNELWNVTFGGNQWENGNSIWPTPDGGYIAVAETYSFGNDNCLLLKTDDMGNEQWKTTMRGEMPFSIHQTSDGGYIFVTNYYDYTTLYDLLLIKTDAQGKEQWTTTFGGSGFDIGTALQFCPDGGYILAGMTSSFGIGNTEGWIIKTDAQGSEEWSLTYCEPHHDIYFFNIQTTQDGGNILIGKDTSLSTGLTKFRVMKTDSQGNAQWSMNYGGEGFSYGYAIEQTNDEGFIAVGETNTYGSGLSDAWLVKLDNIANNRPSQPAITGPSQGKINRELTYTTSTVDTDHDEVYYLWMWGDGTTSEWLGPYQSGESCEAKHTWTQKGTFDIKVKARDSLGGESSWSDAFPVSMTKTSHTINLLQYLFHHRLTTGKPLERVITLYAQMHILFSWRSII